MVNEFSFGLATDIRFGKDSVASIGEIALEYGGKKVLLVADKGIRGTGLPSRIRHYLEDVGIACVDFDKIVPNPRILDCEEGARLGLEEQVNLVVAVGGGSSIDTSKAIAGMIGHKTADFGVIQFPNAYTCDPCPLIAVPTTAGTGSEVTTCGVITNGQTHEKVYCYDIKCAPTVALCDPAVLMGLPASIAAATGIDALTHAIEGYVCTCTNPVTEAFGLYAVKKISRHFRKYIFDRDIESCSEIMVGSMLAGLSFGYSDTAAVHSLAETLGGRYDTPHGVANAIFLADVCEYNIPANVPKYVDIARAMGVTGQGLTDRQIAQAGVDEIRRLVADVRIPKLNELPGIDPEDFDWLAQKCVTHVSNPDNPIILTKEEFRYFLDKAYNA